MNYAREYRARCCVCNRLCKTDDTRCQHCNGTACDAHLIFEHRPIDERQITEVKRVTCANCSVNTPWGFSENFVVIDGQEFEFAQHSAECSRCGRLSTISTDRCGRADYCAVCNHKFAAQPPTPSVFAT